MKITLLIIVATLGFTSVSWAENPKASSSSPAKASAAADDEAIRPFHFTASKEALADLKRRIAATRWPEKEIVVDQSQGVQLATIQKVARYWGTDYDWRKCEARLNALPQFITDIHFIHVRSKDILRYDPREPVRVSGQWPNTN
jgi:hypothetical protein